MSFVTSRSIRLVFLFIILHAFFIIYIVKEKKSEFTHIKAPVEQCPRRNYHKDLATHPLIAIPTVNRPDHLWKTLERLLCIAGASEEKIFIASDADDPSNIQITIMVARHWNVPVIFNLARDQDNHPTSKSNYIRRRITENYIGLFEHAFGALGNQSIMSWTELQAAESELKQTGQRRNIDPVNHLVILEDDLEVADDFIYYFSTMAAMMDRDPTLFCVSAWNDNGYPATAASYSNVRRGQHFMALGWMISRQQYENSIASKLRIIKSDPSTTHDWDFAFIKSFFESTEFECAFPEVSRVHHRRQAQNKAYSTTEALQRDRFDNMNLAQSPQSLFQTTIHEQSVQPYLTDVTITAYRDSIQHFLRNAIKIESVVDILDFSGYAMVYVCPETGDCWDDVLVHDFGVFGRGFDGIVRGIHHDSVFIRYGANLVLILGKGSRYHSEQEETIKALVPASWIPVPERYRIAMDIRVGLDNSCAEMCDESQKDGRVCHEQMLTHMNSCVKLREQFGCLGSCTVVHDFAAPYVSGSRGNGKFENCFVTLPRYLNCSYHKEVSSHLRVCSCADRQQLEQFVLQ